MANTSAVKVCSEYQRGRLGNLAYVSEPQVPNFEKKDPPIKIPSVHSI